MMQGTTVNDMAQRSALVVQSAQHRATTSAVHNERCYVLVAATVADASGREHPLLALRRHLPLIEALRANAVHQGAEQDAAECEGEVQRVAQACGLSEQKVRPLLERTPGNPQASLRPLVLRASLGECIETQITNLLPHTPLCLSLVDDDYGIQQGIQQGIQEGACEHCLAYGEARTYRWHCRHPGIYPMYNRLGVDAAERRCLLGVLIIEP